ncbi:hypothetical protein G9C98_002924 [Cotesia typhae]|uniref:Protein kinase domain-containing protein n=1 Tax=Cotesia typhae TaxID=2053667 RepID=A0A8J5RHU0_9HYME|nr:hypothetical protein G9C98_002924 [Cotesia typhae]
MTSPRLAVTTLSHRGISPKIVKNLLSPRQCYSPQKIAKDSLSPRNENDVRIAIKNRIVPFNIDTPNRKKIVNNDLSNKKKFYLVAVVLELFIKQRNQVAVKIMKRKNLHDTQVEAEERASLLQHPNIVKIIKVEQGSVCSLITMELCVMSLQDKLDKMKLHLIERIQVWSAVASALDFCHNAGIIAWQLISRKIPFANHHPHTTLYLTGKGVRPVDDDVDDGCNGTYKNLYRKSWSQNQETRPNLDFIIFQLNNLLKQIKTST